MLLTHHLILWVMPFAPPEHHQPPDHCHDHNHPHDHSPDHSHHHGLESANHHHGHDSDHAHGHTIHKTQRLTACLVLVVCFAGFEVWMSWLSHSMALLADAGHLTADGLSIGLALFAVWIAQRPATDQAPFGYRRVEVLAALVNGVGLLVVAGLIGSEAIAELQSPPEAILGTPMAIAATIGLGVNSVNAYLLHGDHQHDLNVNAAFLHMLADAGSALGVLIAAIAVATLHWFWADGAISLVVAGLILLGAIPLIRKSLTVLLERPPQGLDMAKLRTWLSQYPGITEIADLKVWAIAPGQTLLLTHLQIEPTDPSTHPLWMPDLQTQLRHEFGIADSWIQTTPATSKASPQDAQALEAVDTPDIPHDTR